jgi:hypothetical protein
LQCFHARYSVDRILSALSGLGKGLKLEKTLFIAALDVVLADVHLRAGTVLIDRLGPSRHSFVRRDLLLLSLHSVMD